MSKKLDVVSEYQQPMRPLLIALLPACLIILGIERRRRRTRDDGSTPADDWSQRVSYSHYVIVAMLFFWAATVVFYGVHQSRLLRMNKELSEKLDKQVDWVKTQGRSNQRSGPYRPNTRLGWAAPTTGAMTNATKNYSTAVSMRPARCFSRSVTETVTH